MMSIEELLKKDYPKTPEHFHQVVENEVNKHLDVSVRMMNLKSKKYKRLIFMFAASLILCCSVLIAARTSMVTHGLSKWLESLGVNREEVEPFILINPDVSYEAESPLLNIQELYIDGTKLIFTAQAAVSLQRHELTIKDHIYINDVDCLNMGFSLIDKEQDIYECSVDISKVPKADSLHVYLRLYTPDGIQDMKFSVSSQNMGLTNQIKEQQFSLKNGLVKLENGSISPTMVELELYFECHGENAEKEINILGGPFYKIKDDNGIIYDVMYISTNWGISDVLADCQEKNGVWSKRQKIQLKDFDVTSKNITFIPYVPEVDELGKFIPDSGVLYEEWEFTLPLILDE